MCLLSKTKLHEWRTVHAYIFLHPPLLPQTPFSSGCHILEKRCEERRRTRRTLDALFCRFAFVGRRRTVKEERGSDIVIAIDQRGKGKNRRVVCSLVPPLLPKPLQIQKRNGDTRLGYSETALNSSFFNNIHVARIVYRLSPLHSGFRICL